MTPIISQLLIGTAAIASSVAVHAWFMMAGLYLFSRIGGWATSNGQRAAITSAVVLWFFLSICAICWGWSVLLLWLGALTTMEEALYFSTVTFTTLGYGDVVLDPRWRLLGAVMAANGTIIIGWTTAMVFVAVQEIYFGENRR